MSVHVEFSGDYLATGGSREEFEAEAGGIMDALLELEASDCGISEPAIAIDLSRFMLTIDVVAAAPSFEEAQQLVDSCVRAAIHKAGGSTPDWHFVPQQMHTGLVDAP